MSAISSLPEQVISQTKPHALDASSPLANGSMVGSNLIRVDSVVNNVPFKLHDSPIENFRPVKAIVIGAGYSGIYLGIRIPEKIRNCELIIYEKNDGLGGTWWENRYPGCACDVP